MEKPRDLKIKIAATVLYLAAVALICHIGANCIFQHYLGIPCPGCGMTRAMLAALHFDFVGAFRHHAMFWAMPLLYLYFIFDGRIFGRRADRAILIAIAAGFALNWIWALLR